MYIIQWSGNSFYDYPTWAGLWNIFGTRRTWNDSCRDSSDACSTDPSWRTSSRRRCTRIYPGSRGTRCAWTNCPFLCTSWCKCRMWTWSSPSGTSGDILGNVSGRTSSCTRNISPDSTRPSSRPCDRPTRRCCRTFACKIRTCTASSVCSSVYCRGTSGLSWFYKGKCPLTFHRIPHCDSTRPSLRNPVCTN